MLWDPIRYAETCPSSDGAFAMVLGSEKVGDGRAPRAGGVGPGHGDALEPTMSADRDTVLPRGGADCAADVYRPGRHHRPAPRRSTASRCTCPFSWFEPMWMENLGFAEPGEGWKIIEDGATRARRRPAR